MLAAGGLGIIAPSNFFNFLEDFTVASGNVFASELLTFPAGASLNA